jgi:hypothetical protein
MQAAFRFERRVEPRLRSRQTAAVRAYGEEPLTALAPVNGRPDRNPADYFFFASFFGFFVSFLRALLPLAIRPS